MNWQARFVILGIIVVPGLFAPRNRIEAQAVEPVADIQRYPPQIALVNPANLPKEPEVTTDSEQAGGRVSTKPVTVTGTASSATPYQVIVERNMFNLQPVPPLPPQPASPPSPPKEDLLLTGLCDLSSARLASFKIAVAGQPPACFTLAEGAQNEWLEVSSVNVTDQTVKIRLKKPVIRIRSVGVEVLLTFQTRTVR